MHGVTMKDTGTFMIRFIASLVISFFVSLIHLRAEVAQTMAWMTEESEFDYKLARGFLPFHADRSGPHSMRVGGFSLGV